MLEKTSLTTKRLFCCVRFICVAMVAMLLFSPMALTVSADSYGNEFLDINDYASYSASADNTKVYASLKFPADWTTTLVIWDYVGTTFGSPDLVMTGNNINIYNESYDSYFSLIMYPFTKFIPVGSSVGYQVQNCKILDLRYLPADSYFTYDFVVKVQNPTTADTEFSGTLREDIIYVDENGEILQHNIDYIADPPQYEDNGYRVMQWGGVLDVEPVEGAVGFIPFFSLRNLECDWDTDIIINYNGLSCYFSVSNLEYDNMQNDRLVATMENVQDQLAEQGKQIDTLTGTVENLPDKIGDEFEGVIDQEKEESKQEGNKFVDQVLDKLPDPSQGVLSALGDLTAAVGYTGTEAVIPFPAIVIPGVEGLFEDIVIYDGSDFDLGSCIDFIPETLLTVIRSLFTIAIVLFCVYELKGVISFIFTLKEKNNG